ncbi:MAG: diguanylate cyclase [Rhodothalassiaceae bacterium]
MPSKSSPASLDNRTPLPGQIAMEEVTGLLQAAERLANLGHWRYDLLSEDVYWSDEVFRIHGYEVGEILPTLQESIAAYHPQDQPIVRSAIDAAIATGQGWCLELRLIRRDGEERRVRSKGTPLLVSGAVVSVFGVFQDITEEADCAKHHQLLRRLVEETPEGVIITDKRGRVQWSNPAMTVLCGYRPDQLLGQKPGRLLQGPETCRETVAYIRAQLDAAQPVKAELLNYRNDGTPYWVRLSIFPKFDQSGDVEHFMSIETNITQEKEAEQALTCHRQALEKANFQLDRQRRAAECLARDHEQARHCLEQEIKQRKMLEADLRKLALYDALTGLPSRQHFLMRCAQEIARARRFGRPVALMMIDIDHFKAINDGHGHAIGDEVLRATGRLIADSVREGSDFAGRLGGEEFCIVAAETTAADAMVLAERLRAGFRGLRVSGAGKGVRVTCSFGVVSLAAGDGVNELLVRADTALYEAKRLGRDRVQMAA